MNYAYEINIVDIIYYVLIKCTTSCVHNTRVKCISPFNCNTFQISIKSACCDFSIKSLDCHRFCKHFKNVIRISKCNGDWKQLDWTICVCQIFPLVFFYSFLFISIYLLLSSALGSFKLFALFAVDCIIGFENCITKFQPYVICCTV